jgi:hypothetical protein
VDLGLMQCSYSSCGLRPGNMLSCGLLPLAAELTQPVLKINHVCTVVVLQSL